MGRFERAGTIVTSNGPVEDWGKLLGDAAAVCAKLDRLHHHGHVPNSGPRDWRTKTNLPAEPQAEYKNLVGGKIAAYLPRAEAIP